MKIAIRLDDITADMDWGKFTRFKSLMEAHGVLPLIGVVPDSEDPMLHIDDKKEDFWQYVQALEESGWTIAMHGVSHVYTTKKGGLFPLNHLSEFAGVPYGTQCEAIARGKKILEDHGILTDIFMAPAHSYDRNTLRALRQNGFTRMTDGFGDAPYRYEGMTFFPISSDRGRCLKDTSDRPTTFVVHTNTMSEADFAYYEKVFAGQDMLPYREYLYYEAKERGALGHLKEWSMASAKRTLVSLKSRK